MTSLRAILFACVAAGAIVVACGNDAPPYGAYPGTPCRTDIDCGGYYCVDSGGGTCQPPCRSEVDCGPGYSCKSQARRGTGGRVNVCLPD